MALRGHQPKNYKRQWGKARPRLIQGGCCAAIFWGRVYPRPGNMCSPFVIGIALILAATSAFSAVIADSQIEAVEFYHDKLDHYFISVDPKEIADLDNGVHSGWARPGMRFQVIKAGATEAASLPVCRFYGKPEVGLDSHFYSATSIECDAVKKDFADSWVLESPEVFRVFAVDPQSGNCPADSVPVFRLWNKRADVNHRYTDQISVFQSMVQKGYVAEGNGSPAFPTAFCVPLKSGLKAPVGSPVCSVTS